VLQGATIARFEIHRRRATSSRKLFGEKRSEEAACSIWWRRRCAFIRLSDTRKDYLPDIEIYRLDITRTAPGARDAPMRMNRRLSTENRKGAVLLSEYQALPDYTPTISYRNSSGGRIPNYDTISVEASPAS